MLITKTIGHFRKFLFTRCFTPKKFLNLLRAQFEYKTRKEVLKAYPYYLVIDPCNSCRGRSFRERSAAPTPYVSIVSRMASYSPCLFYTLASKEGCGFATWY